ncbi:MAG: tail fiber protein, partial [Bacteroidota bacterium]|nr:tail fiber protein [Bacteroidota bacterium]
MDVFLGQILPWPLQWAPVGFNNCDGTKLSVNSNQALFSLISNVYGGDGLSNFALPDLRGRVPVGQDLKAAYGTQYIPGQTGGNGQIAISLTIANMPEHTHSATIGGTATGTLPTMTG